MPNLTPEWLKTALEITGGFETSGNPWAGVSNDFDNMGISCGILQWNIGQGSLQPLINKCGVANVKKYMPVHGDALWSACNGTIVAGLGIVRSWQPGKQLKMDIRKELVTFFGSQEMVQQQMAAAGKVGEDSYRLASQWATELRGGDPTLKEFCVFFDLVTQSGGMKGVWLDAVKAFIASKGRAQTDDSICTWMTTRPPQVQHQADGKKNAALWRNNVPDSDLELFVLAYLRSIKSKEIYQLVALNRRGSIAMTRGWVNGGLRDFQQLR